MGEGDTGMASGGEDAGNPSNEDKPTSEELASYVEAASTTSGATFVAVHAVEHEVAFARAFAK